MEAKKLEQQQSPVKEDKNSKGGPANHTPDPKNDDKNAKI
jgi:hypothetical protein